MDDRSGRANISAEPTTHAIRAHFVKRHVDLSLVRAVREIDDMLFDDTIAGGNARAAKNTGMLLE